MSAVSVAVKNAASELGEGPHWQASTQTLHYVDSLSRHVFQWNVDTQINSKRHVAVDTVGFAIPKQSGGYLLGLGGGLASWDWDSGEHTVNYELTDGKRTRINDGKCDASGRLWTGTMERSTLSSEVPLGAFYSYESGCAPVKRRDNIGISNGLAWTQDNRTMFYTDSMVQTIYAYDYDINAGTNGNERIFADFKKKGLGFPDGMCMDTSRNLWVACFGQGAVVCLDAETGNVTRSLQFPTSLTTSCCFGGKHMDELYVTTANPEGPDFVAHSFRRDALDGSLFKVTGLGVKGVPVADFSG